MYNSLYERYHSVQRHPSVQFRLLMLDCSSNNHDIIDFKMAAIKTMNYMKYIIQYSLHCNYLTNMVLAFNLTF